MVADARQTKIGPRASWNPFTRVNKTPLSLWVAQAIPASSSLQGPLFPTGRKTLGGSTNWLCVVAAEQLLSFIFYFLLLVTFYCKTPERMKDDLIVLRQHIHSSIYRLFRLFVLKKEIYVCACICIHICVQHIHV